MSKVKIYLKSLLIPVLLGALVGLITANSMDYETLEKPFLAPPGWLFPIVWTILYVLMGISYGILKSNMLITEDIKWSYYAQLIVNLIWPIVFFIFKWRLFAFLWIVLLIWLVIQMIMKFYNKNNIAGLLQIPYAIWLIFAAYLNIRVYLLN